MAKTPCSICSTPCVGCRGLCKCGYKVNQAKQSNDLFALYPERLLDSQKVQIITREIKAGHASDVIIRSISEGTPLKDIVYPKSGSIYCEYPVGSGGKGMWVECLKCSKPRFEGIGKLCEGRKEENKEVKEDIKEEE